MGYTILIAARRARRQPRRPWDDRRHCHCGLRASGKHRVETFIQSQARVAGVFLEPRAEADNVTRSPLVEPLGGVLKCKGIHRPPLSAHAENSH